MRPRRAAPAAASAARRADRACCRWPSPIAAGQVLAAGAGPAQQRGAVGCKLPPLVQPCSRAPGMACPALQPTHPCCCCCPAIVASARRLHGSGAAAGGGSGISLTHPGHRRAHARQLRRVSPAGKSAGRGGLYPCMYSVQLRACAVPAQRACAPPAPQVCGGDAAVRGQGGRGGDGGQVGGHGLGAQPARAPGDAPASPTPAQPMPCPASLVHCPPPTPRAATTSGRSSWLCRRWRAWGCRHTRVSTLASCWVRARVLLCTVCAAVGYAGRWLRHAPASGCWHPPHRRSQAWRTI